MSEVFVPNEQELEEFADQLDSAINADRLNFLGAMGFKGHAEGTLTDSNGNKLDSNGNLINIDSNESEGETQ